MYFERISIILLIFIVGCSAHGPLGRNKVVPMEHKQTCMNACKGLKMKLGSMVIISHMTGCVCEVKNKNSLNSGASAAAGGAVISIMAAQQQHQQASMAK